MDSPASDTPALSTSSVRAATPADLDGVVRVFLACWRGYAAVLPAAVVARMDLAGAQDLWRAALDTGGVLVATVPSAAVPSSRPPGSPSPARDTVVGVTRCSLQEDGTGLIGSLYVDPARQGGGWGARLLTAATDRLREFDARVATLWVFADNAPALGFYHRQGWRPDGAGRVDDRFGAREVRLTLHLAPAADRRPGHG